MSRRDFELSSVLKFPESFLWGTATSATQVEGRVANEWTDYVAADGGHWCVACDHYHRYKEDMDWMAQLGVNAYRMGIEWSRLQSAPFAPLNQNELARYVHRRYGLSLYITEHGAASTDEDFRIRDLKEHLCELCTVMDDGVDVRGFFYWSLLDNFEWQFGYTKKFGLLAVDFNDEKLPRKMTRAGEFLSRRLRGA
jgi:beta-glucosidase/6-phospho-beta-glucosidase/beta-galactosidase